MVIRKRINRLEDFKVPRKAKGEPFYISEELYDKLNAAQVFSLPEYVKLDLSTETLDRIEKELRDTDGSNYKPIHRTDEEREEGLKDIRDCYEKYGGLHYDWTPERLEMLKAGKVPE